MPVLHRQDLYMPHYLRTFYPRFVIVLVAFLLFFPACRGERQTFYCDCCSWLENLRILTMSTFGCLFFIICVYTAQFFFCVLRFSFSLMHHCTYDHLHFVQMHCNNSLNNTAMEENKEFHTKQHEKCFFGRRCIGFIRFISGKQKSYKKYLSSSCCECHQSMKLLNHSTLKQFVSLWSFNHSCMDSW